MSKSIVKTVVFWGVVVVSAFLLWQVVRAGGPENSAPYISYSEFLTRVEKGNVARVSISGSQIHGLDRDGGMFQVIGPQSHDYMLQLLHQQGVEIWFRDTQDRGLSSWLMNLAPLVLLAALWFFMIRQIKTGRRPQATGEIATENSPAHLR